ncbi:YtfJ family protein [Providencia stuartii]|nr:YtfJ family protein [Providencia stuartii]
MKRSKKANFPHDAYQTTSIINADDAIFGTGVFVSNSVEDSKKRVSLFAIYR